MTSGDPLRDLYSLLLGWLPAGWRVSIIILLTVALVQKVLPVLLRWCGHGVRLLTMPLVSLLAYPEYLLTSLHRRRGWPLLPGTHEYGHALAALAEGGRGLGSWLSNRFQTRHKYPWKAGLVCSLILITCWHLQPVVRPGAVGNAVSGINTATLRFDTWVATSNWPAVELKPAGPKPKAVARKAKSAPPKKKPTQKVKSAGTWIGTYTCRQGVTGLRLEISGTATDIKATFNFYPIPENPDVPQGSFAMAGIASGSRISLTASKWIDQPTGWIMLDLRGSLAPDSRTLNFTIDKNGAGCVPSFTVVRT